MTTPADSPPRPSRKENAFRFGLAFALVMVFVVLFCLGEPPLTRSLPRTLTLYGFSAMEEAVEDGLFPAFQERWQRTAGQRVELAATFAGSGTITGRILERLPVEVAILSSALDARRLSEGGLAKVTLRELPHEGVLARTPLVVLARPGNPAAFADFADLAREGVAVVHPDPATSGAGQWAILAVHGAAARHAEAPATALDALRGIWRRVVIRPASARAARAAFLAGDGDALLTYEQEALAQPGRPAIDAAVVVPPATVLCEAVVVRLDKNVRDEARPLVDAFVDFLWSAEGQGILVDYGFRSVDEALNARRADFAELGSVFTLAELGGAREAERRILVEAWQQGVEPELAAASRSGAPASP